MRNVRYPHLLVCGAVGPAVCQHGNSKDIEKTMELNGKEWTIAGLIVSWIVTLIGYGKTYGNLSNRVKNLEGKSPCVTPEQCAERRAALDRENAFQFSSGKEQFQKIEAMIVRIEQRHTESHSEIMRAIMEIKSK